MPRYEKITLNLTGADLIYGKIDIKLKCRKQLRPMKRNEKLATSSDETERKTKMPGLRE